MSALRNTIFLVFVILINHYDIALTAKIPLPISRQRDSFRYTALLLRHSTYALCASWSRRTDTSVRRLW